MLRMQLRRFVTEDLPTKFLAFFVAFLLWAGVSFLGSQTVTVEHVPVTVTNLRDDLALVAPITPVRVRIRAPRLLLRQRQSAELVRAFVDLSGRGLGAQAADPIATPNDSRVDVLAVLPERVSFALDPVVQRSLPLKVVPDGMPAEGFAVGEATVEPTTVRVRGALRRIQETAAIEVKISVRDATVSVEGETPVSPPEGLSASPDRVHVKVEIIRAEETRTLGVRVVTQGTPAAGYWVRSVAADPATVTVKGSRDVLSDRKFIETVPVSVDGARELIQKAVDLALQDGVAPVEGEPRVRVTVDITALTGTKDVSAVVQVGDVPGGLRVTTVSLGNARVTVQGSGEAFDRLRSEDVRVVLSAQGQTAGTFRVRVSPDQVRVPDGIRVVSVEGTEVSVTLEES